MWALVTLNNLGFGESEMSVASVDGHEKAMTLSLAGISTLNSYFFPLFTKKNVKRCSGFWIYFKVKKSPITAFLFIELHFTQNFK